MGQIPRSIERISSYENEMLFAHMPTSTYAMTYSECSYFV